MENVTFRLLGGRKGLTRYASVKPGALYLVNLHQTYSHSHFLMLLNLFLLLLVVFHDLYALGLHQATFLYVELLLRL